MMSVMALILLALGMSVDACVAAMCQGAVLKQVSGRVCVRTALIFGVTEMIAPVLGWLAGRAAHHLIEAYDHWIAFVLLMILGIRMMRGCVHEAPATLPETLPTQQHHNQFMLMMTAIATSVDSMVVGVSLAFLDVNIVWAAITIGLMTTMMTAIGLHVGAAMGMAMGRKATVFGGLVLMGIGTFILLEHLGFLGI